MFVSVCRVFLPDGRVRMMIDGPYSTPEEAIGAKADALDGTIYDAAMTDTFRVAGDVDILELVQEQVVNVLKAYAPEP